MKCFNSMCLTTLLVCGAYCTSNLHAESSEFTEQYDEVIDNDISEGTTGKEQEIKRSRDIPGTTGEISGVYINVGENAAGNAVEVTTDISISNQSIDNAITTVEIEVPVVANDLDNMVEELAQSGAVQNDLSNIEAQPQWKIILASIASYAISVSLSFQQLLTTILTSLQNTLAGNNATKKASNKR